MGTRCTVRVITNNGRTGGRLPTATLMNIHLLDFHQTFFGLHGLPVQRLAENDVCAVYVFAFKPQADITLFLGNTAQAERNSVAGMLSSPKLIVIPGAAQVRAWLEPRWP